MQDLREGKSEMRPKPSTKAKMSTVSSRKENLGSLAKSNFDSCQRLDKECEPAASPHRKRPQPQYVLTIGSIHNNTNLSTGILCS
jgi:hypothetical protein